VLKQILPYDSPAMLKSSASIDSGVSGAATIQRNCLDQGMDRQTRSQLQPAQRQLGDAPNKHGLAGRHA